MRIVSIVGARPQFIKIAPLCREIDRINLETQQKIEHIIVHTGQHYDDDMSLVFFQQLEIPNPDLDLGVGSGSHGLQTGRMLERIEEVLIRLEPHYVLIFGDRNSNFFSNFSN